MCKQYVYIYLQAVTRALIFDAHSSACWAGSGANYFVGQAGAWNSGIWDQVSGTMTLTLGPWATVPSQQLTVFSFVLRSVTSDTKLLHGTPFITVLGNYNISSQVLNRRYGSTNDTWNYSQPFGVVLDPNVSSGRSFSIADGTNYGTADYSLQWRLGGTVAEASIWVSDSFIDVKIANGLGPGQICFDAVSNSYFSCGQTLAVTVVRDEVSTFVKSFIYNEPVVLAVTPNSGQIAGADSVTILGTNFGIYDSTVKVFIESRGCEASIWYSNSQVLCKTPRIDKTVHSRVCDQSHLKLVARSCALFFKLPFTNGKKASIDF